MKNLSTNQVAGQNPSSSSSRPESELKQFERLLDQFFKVTGI